MSCQKCGKPGHNRRTCTRRQSATWTRAMNRERKKVAQTPSLQSPDGLQEMVGELVGRATPEICEEIRDLLEKAHQDMSRAKHRGRALLTLLPPKAESWEHDLRLIQWLAQELDTLDSVTKRLTSYLFRPPPTNTTPPEETP